MQGIGVSLCITAIAAIALSLTLIPAVMLTFPDFFINWVPKSLTQQPSHEEENEGLLGREAQRAKSGREVSHGIGLYLSESLIYNYILCISHCGSG